MELLIQALDEIDDLVTVLWHVWLRGRRAVWTRVRTGAPGDRRYYLRISLQDAPYAKQL
jgi:hypothetical protein